MFSLLFLSLVLSAQPLDCPTAAECRERTLAALAEEQFERAHDLAWRVYQLSPRNDPAAMSLLARAQSLSGRADDAYVMLQRLAGAGVAVTEALTSDDFRRVREHARWPELRDQIARLAAPAAPADPREGAVPDATARTAAPSPPAVVAPSAPVAPAAPGLALPDALPAPTAMVYDAVSARFIVANAVTDVLRVVSENSGNATNLLTAGWSGAGVVTAMAINTRTGDLWVATHGQGGSALHRFQLISGRRLQTITPSDALGATRFVAVGVTGDGVFALDAAGRRLLALSGADFRVLTTFSKDMEPVALARGGPAWYVSHARGLIRVDARSGAQQPVLFPAGEPVGPVYSLAWHNGTLFGVRAGDSGTHVVRMRLAAGGGRITSVEALTAAESTTGDLANGRYYFLGVQSDDSGLAFRRIEAGK